MSENNLIVLRITGLENVPSFKNGKMLTRGRLITHPKKKLWMERAIRLIESQLHGLFPTEEGAMRGECQKPLPTVSFPLFDDSMDYMIPGHQDVQRVPKGEEGCIITIERI